MMTIVWPETVPNSGPPTKQTVVGFKVGIPNVTLHETLSVELSKKGHKTEALE